MPTAVVVGLGTERGIGGAVARRFAREGYHVLLGGRTPEKIEALAALIASEGGSAEAVQTDATSETDVIRLFDRAMAPGEGREAADVVIFNAGNNRVLNFRELGAQEFEDYWRVGCYAGFLVGREAARRLVPLGRGTVIFTGASASLRGKPNFAHFASAKAGLRAISQSMAREFGPQGIHVAHVIIDGGVDGDRLRTFVPEFAERLGKEGMLQVDDIADNYWHLHKQRESAWTQELDLRPFKENF